MREYKYLLHYNNIKVKKKTTNSKKFCIAGRHPTGPRGKLHMLVLQAHVLFKLLVYSFFIPFLAIERLPLSSK
jgi:hypothetical protein